MEDTTELRLQVGELAQRVEKLEANRPKRLVRELKATVEKQEQLEGWLAGYWFARLGIVSLVTGIAFLVADSFTRFGASLKVLLGYMIAATMIGGGRWVTARQQALGRILVAGGLGVVYFTTYAMHFVPSAQLITSPALAFAALFAVVLVIIAVADWMQSETVAGVALFLGLHTGMVSPVGEFTLLSGGLLAAGAAFFLAKNRWVYVPISTLLAVYCTHVLWMKGNIMLVASTGHDLGHFWTSIGFALLYFAIFSTALVLTPKDAPKSATLLFAFLNWSAFVAIACLEYSYHQAPGLPVALATLAGALLLLALVSARVRGTGTVFEIHIVLALATGLLASWFAMKGVSLTLAWCGVSLAALLAAKPLKLERLRQLSTVALVLAAFAYLANSTAIAPASVLILTAFAHERVHPRGRGRLVYPGAMAALSLFALSLSLQSHHTLLWMGTGLVVLAAGSFLRELSYRVVAICVLVLAFARLFLFDMARLSSGHRIASFVVLGIVLLGISAAYSRLQRGSACS